MADNGYKLLRNMLLVILPLLILEIGTTIWWAASITVRVEHLEEKLIKLEESVSKEMDDRYRSRDAARDFTIRDDQLDDLDNRLRALEKTQYKK